MMVSKRKLLFIGCQFQILRLSFRGVNTKVTISYRVTMTMNGSLENKQVIGKLREMNMIT